MNNKLNEINEISILINKIKFARYNEEKEKTSILYNLTTNDILNILKYQPYLYGLFNMDYFKNKNIFTNELFNIMIDKSILNFEFIPIESITIELLKKYIENIPNIINMKNSFHIELLNKIDLTILKSKFQKLETKQQVEFIDSIMMFNTIPDIEETHIIWKTKRCDVQFDLFEKLNKYYTKNIETKKTYKNLKSKFKLVNQFYFKFLIEDNENFIDNLKLLKNQYSNNIINELYKFIKSNFLGNNDIIKKHPNFNNIFINIPKTYHTSKLINLCAEIDEISLTFAKPDLISKHYFKKLFNKYINSVDKNISYESLIVNLLRNQKHYSLKILIKLIHLKQDKIIKMSIHYFDKELLTEDTIIYLLNLNIYSDYYSFFYNNKNKDKILTKYVVNSILSNNNKLLQKQEKQYFKNNIKEFLNDDLLYLLDINNNDYYIELLEEDSYNILNIPVDKQTTELFELLKLNNTKEELISIFNNDISKINPKFLFKENINELIFSNKIELFENIAKNTFILNDIQINRNLAKKKIFWKFINKSFLDDDVLLFNLINADQKLNLKEVKETFDIE
jgi:hypothetical protein